MPTVKYLDPGEPWMGAVVSDRLTDCGAYYRIQVLPVFTGQDKHGNLHLHSFTYTLASATHISGRDFSAIALLMNQAQELTVKLKETYQKHMQNKLDVLAQANTQLQAVWKAVESGQVNWKSVPPPKEGASRAFSGTASGFQIMVVQANTPEYGIIHEGMVLSSGSAVSVIRLPPEMADKIYHVAAQTQN